MRKITSLLMLFFAFVGMAWGQITNLSELSNTKAYLLKNANEYGYAIWKSGDNLTLCGSTKSSFTDELVPNELNNNWQILSVGGKYYLYNVGAKKFAVTQGGPTYLQSEPKAISIIAVNGGFAFNSDGDSQHYMCASHQSHHASAPIQFWTSSDLGSSWEIHENEAIDAVHLTEIVNKLKLSDKIKELQNKVGKIQLQTTNANDAFYLSATTQGDAPISKAIDGDPATYYGSTWESTVGHHHYWQVDLGAGTELAEFIFSYITRANNSDTPTKINVQGSNDGESFDNIVVLEEGLPNGGGLLYTSETITNNGYRYIRFEVPSTVNNYSAAGNAEQEVTIAIAEFSMSKPESSYTDEDRSLLTKIASAQAVLDDENSTESDYKNAYKDLCMATVVKPTYPFTITTDDDTPVVYAIKSGRGDAYWYTYDSTDGMIALSQYTAAQNQLFYFKEVITDDYKYALQIFPYLGEGKAMSYENSQNGSAKVVAKDLNTTGWNNYWTLVSTNGTAPYGLKTYDDANYLSNNGGVNYKMGMWNASPSADGGSAMYFINPAEAKEDLIEKVENLLNNKGTTVGYLTSASYDNLAAVAAEAKTEVNVKDFGVDKLNNALYNVETIQPDPNKFYKIVSSCTKDHRAGQNIYVNNTGGMQFAHPNDVATDFARVWQFVSAGDGKFYLKNVERGTFMNTAKDHNGGQETAVGTEAEAKAISIANMGRANIVSLIPDGGAMMHAQDRGSQVVAWNSESTSDASAWKIEEVDINTINREVTVGAAGYSTLVLGYNAEIPADVEVYTVSNIGSDYVTLSEVTGILPAGEAVVLKNEGTYNFNYTAEEATKDEGNLLEGTVFNTYLTGTAYVLSKPEGSEVGLYKAALNKTATGAAPEEGQQGTHFLNNAFKAYLPLTTGGSVNALRFNFDGETTAIETVETENANAPIYDLSGRRVLSTVKGGIYIQNGKKFIVK